MTLTEERFFQAPPAGALQALPPGRCKRGESLRPSVLVPCFAGGRARPRLSSLLSVSKLRNPHRFLPGVDDCDREVMMGVEDDDCDGSRSCWPSLPEKAKTANNHTAITAIGCSGPRSQAVSIGSIGSYMQMEALMS